MRFISCSAGKVDISRQGKIFTRRSKETAVEDVNFYDRFHVRALTRVLMWAWTRFCKARWGGGGCGGRWEMSGDHQLTLRQGVFYWLPSSCSYFWWGSNTLVIICPFLFHPQLPQHFHLREHFLWLPFSLDIWQIFSHSVAFPKEKWHTTKLLLWQKLPFNISQIISNISHLISSIYLK